MTLDLKGTGMTSQRARDRLIQRLVKEGIQHPEVLAVMRDTPRHIFIQEALASRAYDDVSLPIGFGQTISQPYIVAKMTELLLARGRLNKVLEIGTGCGYQTAVLAQLVDHVYSVERIRELQKTAKDTIWALKLKNIRFYHGDGSLGWPEQAPFDGILAAAAPESVPNALLEQLAPNGVMVIPIGASGKQVLHRITRTGNSYDVENFGGVEFVPFVTDKR